jgi:hypothetical protein
VDLAAVAAFTAAGLSLVNVAISARLASRGQREQWRRDQERPVVARCLTLSDDAASEWWEAAKPQFVEAEDDPRTRMELHEDKGRELLRDLRNEVAQLDFLASRAVRQVARDLVEAHQREMSRLVTKAQSRQNPFEVTLAAQDRIKELQSALMERSRTDLGLDLGVRVPPGSLLGQMLGRRYR